MKLPTTTTTVPRVIIWKICWTQVQFSSVCEETAFIIGVDRFSLLVEAVAEELTENYVAESRGEFGNPEEGECPSLEAVTRKI
jgi:hypothetical protein